MFLLWKVLASRFYAAEIASAISHMHALRLMHRDLKASNIVLCSRGHTKVVDFGCAKQLPVAQQRDGGINFSGREWAKSQTYCGTPHCMAPEMVSRRGHTPAVDWW